MPHSLRAKLSGLRYKGILADKDYKRLCKALDNEDVLEKIRAEIVQMNDDVSKMLMPFDSLEKVKYTTGFIDGLGSTLDVIDKYREGGAK